MKWHTHILFSAILCIALIKLLGWEVDYKIMVAVIGTYAILPDMDLYLRGLIGHRTYTHTLYFAFLSSIPLIFIFGFQYFIIGLISIIGHLLADMMTVSGVRLFYPDKRTYHILPYNLLVKTGSKEEMIFMGSLAVILSLLWAMPSYANEDKTNPYQLLTNKEILELQNELRYNKILVSVSIRENLTDLDYDGVRLAYIDFDGIDLVLYDTITHFRWQNIEKFEIEDKLPTEVRKERILISELPRKLRNNIIIGFEIPDSGGWYWDCGIWTGKDCYYYIIDNYNITKDKALLFEYII